NLLLPGGILLGADFDVNGYSIVSSADGDIMITPDGTGSIEATNLKLMSNMDANGYNIVFDTNTGILDDSGNEQLLFTKTASAVNNLNVTNTATGTGPLLSVVGGDTNIDLRLDAKGSGRIKALTGLDVTGTLT